MTPDAPPTPAPLVCYERLQHDGVWVRSAPMPVTCAERLMGEWRAKGWHASRLRIACPRTETFDRAPVRPVEFGAPNGAGGDAQRSAEP